MIKIEHLTKTYGDFVALKDLNLEIPDGQFTVLLGPSGAGKTTVLRMLNRMVTPTSGRILLDSVDIGVGKPQDLRRRMGYVIQNTGLFPNMNVRRNVGTVPRLLGWDKKKTAERVDEMLDLVGLDPDSYGPKLPSQLSGGEAQRVGVARSLAADPPIILMDEPFGAVDPITRSHLQLELKSLHRRLKKTIVLVTHDIDEAVLLAEKIALFRNGTLQQYATSEQLWKHPANEFVRDFFGDDLGIRLMQRHTLSELDLRTAEPSSASNGLPELERSATFRDALAALIDSENGEISVVENGVPVGVATFDLLTAALEKGAS